MYFIFSLVLILLLISPINGYSNQNQVNNKGLDCVRDYMQQDKPVIHNLSEEDILKLENYIDTPEEGMKLLGEHGDTYAAIAENVLRSDSPFPYTLLRKFIQNHWHNTVGDQAIKDKFNLVAKQHFKQYIEMVKQGSLPDSDQILNSYLNAVRVHNLPDITVFDAAWAASDKNKLITWEQLNNLPETRIVSPSKVCFNIDRNEANKVIRANFKMLSREEIRSIYNFQNPTQNNPFSSFFQILLPHMHKKNFQ